MGIFFKDKKEGSVKTDNPPLTKPKGPQSLMPVDTSAPTQVVKSNTDYEAHLEKIIEKNDQSGLDYREFMGAIKALDGQAITEEQKYIITYPTYNAMGMTSKRLIESAKFYISKLEEEKIDFEKEMEQARMTGVDLRAKQIADTNKEIEELTRKVQERSAQVQKLTEEMNKCTITLQSEKAAFENAYNNKIALINNHITNFEKYLPYVKSTSK